MACCFGDKMLLLSTKVGNESYELDDHPCYPSQHNHMPWFLLCVWVCVFYSFHDEHFQCLIRVLTKLNLTFDVRMLLEPLGRKSPKLFGSDEKTVEWWNFIRYRIFRMIFWMTLPILIDKRLMSDHREIIRELDFFNQKNYFTIIIVCMCERIKTIVWETKIWLMLHHSSIVFWTEKSDRLWIIFWVKQTGK